MPRKPTDEALEAGGVATVEVGRVPEPEPEPVPMGPLEQAPDFEDQAVTIRPPRAHRADPTAWAVEARVVYLGNHPTKNVYLKGSVRAIADPADPLNKQRRLYVPSTEGATVYDFSTVDLNGAPIPERLTRREEKPWHIVRHIGHLAWFLRHEGQDNAPEFSVRAAPDVALKIEQFVRAELERERRDMDRGRPVLAAMGLA